MKTLIKLNNDGSLKKACGRLTVKELRKNGMFGEKEEVEQ